MGVAVIVETGVGVLVVLARITSVGVGVPEIAASRVLVGDGEIVPPTTVGTCTAAKLPASGEGVTLNGEGVSFTIDD